MIRRLFGILMLMFLFNGCLDIGTQLAVTAAEMVIDTAYTQSQKPPQQRTDEESKAGFYEQKTGH